MIRTELLLVRFINQYNIESYIFSDALATDPLGSRVPLPAPRGMHGR